MGVQVDNDGNIPDSAILTPDGYYNCDYFPAQATYIGITVTWCGHSGVYVQSHFDDKPSWYLGQTTDFFGYLPSSGGLYNSGDAPNFVACCTIYRGELPVTFTESINANFGAERTAFMETCVCDPSHQHCP